MVNGKFGPPTLSPQRTRQAALGGVGLALLADWLVRREIESGALVHVLAGYDVNPGPMQVCLYAMYPVNRRGSPKVKAFVDMLAAALQQ